jgi:addiction module HigA family antidote
MSESALANKLGVSVQVISDLVEGDRVTAEMARLLADAFGTSAEFWVNAQSTYDLATRP